MPPKRKFRGGAVSGRDRKSRRVSPTCKILTACVKCVVASTQFVGGSVTLGYNRIKKCHPYIYIYTLHFTLVSVATDGYFFHILTGSYRFCRFCRFCFIYPRSCKMFPISYLVYSVNYFTCLLITNNIPCL